MRKILLAEDEVMLRVVAEDTLTEAGFQVLPAADGEEALALLKLDPDVSFLISDVRMPKMDGVALIKAALKFNARLKVVLMTGYAGDIPSDLLELPIKLLHKPFNVDRLSEVVIAMGGPSP